MKTFRPFCLVLLGLACVWPVRLNGTTLPSGSVNPVASGWNGKPQPSLEASFESLLDGDRRPDLVQCQAEGTSCQITIQLTTRNELVHLGMQGMPRDVALSAVDVDRDNDRDLVIATPGGLVPVAVWLNDGAGHFTEADPKRYAVPDAPTTKDGSIHEGGGSEANAVATIQFWHVSLDNPLVAFQTPAWNAQATLVESDGHVSQSSLLFPSPRAPPFSVVL
jgi:hypothetical protein